MEDTPAFRAGIRSGDQIISIDGKSAADMNLMEAVRVIRGPVGTAVKFTILRPGVKEPLEVRVVRAKIPMISVKTQELGNGVGYIHIRNFQGGTSLELEKAVSTLEKAGSLKSVILDLRNDPGGLLDQSVSVSGLFLGTVPVVETRGRRDDQDVVYRSDKNSVVPYELPMVVLVNEGSASASEIVAGALQDYGRALILGTQTFGKGSVQSIVPLPDGSGMRLTTARFYTPTGRSIQLDGIKPDVVVKNPLPKDYTMPREKDLEGHLEGSNDRPGSVKGKNNKRPTTPLPEPQVEEEEPYTAPEKHFSQMTPAERLASDKQLSAAYDMLIKGKVESKYRGTPGGEVPPVADADGDIILDNPGVI
jgi:carboxyl-terminal processing protease